MKEETIMPIQPLIDGRFVPNKIVEYLLDNGGIDLNQIARMNFTKQERMQFAQLIGYSLSGFGSLSYVDNETYDTAENMVEGERQNLARIIYLRGVIETSRKHLNKAVVELFEVHEDDLYDIGGVS